MGDTIEVDINVNMNNVDEVDELTSKIQEATNEVERLEDALAEAELNGEDIEADAISDELADATAEAESLKEQLDALGDTVIEPQVEIDNSSVDETKDKLEDTESSASGLGLALGGAVASLGIEQMVEKADNVRTSWNQLRLTFGGTAASMDDLKTKTSEVSESTGRAGSTVRGYFNDMGIAGVTNTNLLSQSFQSLAGKSYQTGNSIESMEQKMKMMVMSGNAAPKALTALGISSEDLARVMGVSAEEVSDAFKDMTPEERLQAITKAMGDGKTANEMYKNSFAGMKEQMSIALGGLMAAIGEGVLPTVIPAVQMVTGAIKTLSGAFKSLPGPLQGVIGGFAGFLAVGATVIGTMGAIGKVGSGVVDGLKSIKNGYNTVKNAMSTAKAALDALRASESITEGVRAALAVVTGAEATAEGADAAAKTAATGPTWGLAIAENALLWPILLVTAAIIAIIAILWYLYNTNEDVRNGVNWLATEFQKLGQTIYTSVVTAIEWITNALQGLYDYIMTMGGLIPEGVSLTGNQIIDSILAVIMFIWTLPLQLGMIFINTIAKVMGFGDNFAQNMLMAGVKALTGIVRGLIMLPLRINAILMSVFTYVTVWASNLISKGVQAATGFVNGVRNVISSLGSAIQSALSNIANIIFRPFQEAYNKVKPIIDAIKAGVDAVTGYLGYEGGDFGYSDFGTSGSGTLNGTLQGMVSSSANSRTANINNNFYGLVEESAADYIVSAVNDRIRKENIMRGI